MILYALACESDHRFDSWFNDSSTFDTLAARGHLACPACGSANVGKAIMAPAVVGGRQAAILETSAPKPDSTEPVASRPATDVALLDPRRQELRAMIKALHAKVAAETQDVGRRFPEEARRIHEGDAPERQIRGQATSDEARSLLDDGILVMPLPALPDEMN